MKTDTQMVAYKFWCRGYEAAQQGLPCNPPHGLSEFDTESWVAGWEDFDK